MSGIIFLGPIEKEVTTDTLLAAIDTTALNSGQTVWSDESGLYWFDNELGNVGTNDVEADDGLGIFRKNSKAFIKINDNSYISALNLGDASLDLTEGKMFVGNSSNVATQLDTTGDGKLIIGNGTTVTSVAMSGLIAITNAGVTSAPLAIGSLLVGAGDPAIATALDCKGDGKLVLGDGTTIASVAMSGDIAITSAGVTTIQAASVDLAMLAAGIKPSHVARYAGTHAYGGGGTSDAATVAGVADTDIILAVIKASTNSVSINKAIPTADTITFTFSGDPGAATEVFYIAFNAAS